jgi:hypothetical protein
MHNSRPCSWSASRWGRQRGATTCAIMSVCVKTRSRSVELACQEHYRAPLDVMVKGLVGAFVDSKTVRVDNAARPSGTTAKFLDNNDPSQ